MEKVRHTDDVGHDPFIEHLIAKGHWIGVYPSYDVDGAFDGWVAMLEPEKAGTIGIVGTTPLDAMSGVLEHHRGKYRSNTEKHLQ